MKDDEIYDFYPVLEEDMQCCVSEADEHELTGEEVCSKCLNAANENPNEAKYAFCGMDSERKFPLNVNDMKFIVEEFYCLEHAGEFEFTEEEENDIEDFIEKVTKDL